MQGRVGSGAQGCGFRVFGGREPTILGNALHNPASVWLGQVGPTAQYRA